MPAFSHWLLSLMTTLGTSAFYKKSRWLFEEHCVTRLMQTKHFLLLRHHIKSILTSETRLYFYFELGLSQKRQRVQWVPLSLIKKDIIMDFKYVREWFSYSVWGSTGSRRSCWMWSCTPTASCSKPSDEVAYEHNTSCWILPYGYLDRFYIQYVLCFV